MIMNCLLCSQKFDVDPDDPQYKKLARKETKFYICKSCNNDTKQTSINSSGIDPTSIDKHDLIIKRQR
ncbi:DUF2197 domain-containing protein [Virgibacillus doumboii]|uniref:DUF2197 domain-containing protein n=1 Tax=Virgibacillus doumboii TaxID=2697503 RepID=UPI0013DF6C90|nr:DUF2197 domain-containing protein [Virgibacillus doumboii]